MENKYISYASRDELISYVQVLVYVDIFVMSKSNLRPHKEQITEDLVTMFMPMADHQMIRSFVPVDLVLEHVQDLFEDDWVGGQVDAVAFSDAVNTIIKRIWQEQLDKLCEDGVAEMIYVPDSPHGFDYRLKKDNND